MGRTWPMGSRTGAGVDTTTETTTAAAPVLSDATPDTGPKRWHIGTLSYTAGGLVVLFFWLLWGDFTISLKDRSVLPTLQVLLRTYQAKAVVFALLLSILPPLVSIFL